VTAKKCLKQTGVQDELCIALGSPLRTRRTYLKRTATTKLFSSKAGAKSLHNCEFPPFFPLNLAKEELLNSKSERLKKKGGGSKREKNKDRSTCLRISSLST